MTTAEVTTEDMLALLDEFRSGENQSADTKRASAISNPGYGFCKLARYHHRRATILTEIAARLTGDPE